MIKLATSSNIVCERPDGTVFPLEKTLKLASEAGFSTFDVSFYDWALPHSPFLTGAWEAWIHGVAEYAVRLGVRFGQCHAYTYDFLNPCYSEEERTRHELLVERSLHCCAILGATLCVTHPDTDWESGDPPGISKPKNLAYFERLLSVAQRYGLSLAIENMCDYAIRPKRKFCAQPEELVDLVDAFDDPRLGVCWDFEHGDIMEQNQADALKRIGSRLMATHVSDTHSKTDPDYMHVMPFFGTIDWPAAMRALAEIGYCGELCLEAHNYANRLPDALLADALKLSYKIGQHLLLLYAQGCDARCSK